MALARRSRDSGMNYWPGFVDALSTLLLGIIFLLTTFVVVQFYLTQEMTGKDTALSRLNAQIAQLTELLSLEKSGKASADEELAQLKSNLIAAEGERDRYKGLYEGAGSGNLDVQGKVTTLSSALDAEKRISGRALAQVEVLNQQIAALRRQLAALQDVLDASAQKDKEAQIQITDLGQRLNVALAQPQPPCSISTRRSRARSPGCCGSTVIPTCARSSAGNSNRTGTCRRRARSRSCNT